MEVEYLKPGSTGYTIYSKSGCTNCSKVKNLLKGANACFNVVDCDEYLIEDRESFLKFIEEITGSCVKTFPMVFYEKKYIGGYGDAEKHHNMLSAFSNNVFF